jgi:outer membrane protein, heavy metal efflux system
MFWQFPGRLFIGCLISLFFSSGVFAAIPDAVWSNWFVTQIEQHPDVIAAKENMNSVFSSAENLEQPLYNPELETEYEREEESNNYRVGFNQTIDWWDKRSVRKQQAIFSRTAAKQAFQVEKQQKVTEALQAIVEWQGASRRAELAVEQEAQLGTLLDIVQSRQRAGDLGQVDAELTFLGLSRRLNETAQAQARLRQTEARLHELLPDWSSEWSQIPDKLWSGSHMAPDDRWVDEHPTVLAARGEWEILQQSAELARRDAKADPTFGINAGQSTEGDVAAITFSIPLNVRNNFSAAARAASQQALSAEASYRATRRRQQANISAAHSTLQAYQRQYDRWKSLMEGRGERSGSLLEKQWTGGDLSTTEYLLALQQRTEGLLAGIELSTEFQLARIEWLFQSGQINTALAQSTK